MGEELTNIAVVLEVVKCWDKTPDDYVFLETIKVVDLA
jgi:hypothetical protein